MQTLLNPNTSATPKWVVLPHFAFAALAFLVLNVLLLFSGDAFGGHYFHPKLLTLTHVAVLGWATMVIFGALYQLLPVVLQVSLYSPRLAQVTFFLLGTGTILLGYAFWTFSVGAVLLVAASALVLAFLLFNLNLWLTIRQTSHASIEADFIGTSGIWLLVTGVVGLLMAINFTHPFLPESHLHYLKLHAHVGVGGWFLLLIMGVGSKLLPMFLLSHQLPARNLHMAYYLVNAGLVLFVADQLFWHSPYQGLYGFLVAAGVLVFGLYLGEAYRKRMRRQQDAGMQQSLRAVMLLVLPVLLVLVLSEQVPLPGWVRQQLYLAYGISVFMGFLTALILGQTFKTLPFLVWMHRFQHLVGKKPTPQPSHLYSERLLRVQNAAYLAGFAGLLGGVVAGQSWLLLLGSLLLLLTSVLYVLNVFKVLIRVIE
jgi:hypothetical protein